MSIQRAQALSGSALVLALGAALAMVRPRDRAPGPVAMPQGRGPSPVAEHVHDWDWLVGRWNVRHHRLKGRLVGSTTWEDFNGTSVERKTMGGQGTFDDNVIELPDGTYRAVGFRAFDPKSGEWLIWWLDGRYPTDIEPPVHGGFKDGVGTFFGDDSLNGRPIKVRFTWSRITATSAHWEQAFSPDGGKTWETNWTMEFARAGGGESEK
jgi:hypothetical protein